MSLMAQKDMPTSNSELNICRDIHTYDQDYMKIEVKAPALSGILLRFFAWILENCITGPIAKWYLKNTNFITQFFVKTQYIEPPMTIPRFPIKVYEEADVLQLKSGESPCQHLASAVECLPSGLHDSKKFFYRWTIRDYSEAYKSGNITPTAVIQRFLIALKDSTQRQPNIGFFISSYKEDIIKQAEMSTNRYRNGKPLSILDGVPIAIKDEIDCLPYPTTGGSKWLTRIRNVKEDAECVKHLRECGAILVGKTNMNELGAGIQGINPHYSCSRNPYDTKRFSGGSSGGSAAVVAAGLCPAALGVDGGGSVRIPSTLCGVIGFKVTFGRVSSRGVLPLNWSLGSVGIHAATVEDALIMYAAIYGHLPTDNIVSTPPPTNLPILGSPEVNNIISTTKFGKYTKWFEDCDSPIHETCQEVLTGIQQQYHCKVVEITLPNPELIQRGHYITLATESLTSFGLDFRKWGWNVSGMDLRASFGMYSAFTNNEYLNSQRSRHKLLKDFMEIFKTVDVIVTPATASTAKPINKGAEKVGELDYILAGKIMKYQVVANFLGFPAITIPVGHDKEGMPIGVQLLGAPWSEATLLRIAFCFQKLCVPDIKPPVVKYDLLALS